MQVPTLLPGHHTGFALPLHGSFAPRRGRGYCLGRGRSKAENICSGPSEAQPGTMCKDHRAHRMLVRVSSPPEPRNFPHQPTRCSLLPHPQQPHLAYGTRLPKECKICLERPSDFCLVTRIGPQPGSMPWSLKSWSSCSFWRDASVAAIRE